MFTLRRYTSADQKNVEYLHVHALQQHLDTAVVQIPARRLYEKKGYREVGRDIYSGLEVILYEKELE